MGLHSAPLLGSYAVFTLHCCQVLGFREMLRHCSESGKTQSKMWEAKVVVPKLPGIQSPLRNCTEEAGIKWKAGGSPPATRPGPETLKLPGIHSPLGHTDLGMSWGPVG